MKISRIHARILLTVIFVGVSVLVTIFLVTNNSNTPSSSIKESFQIESSDNPTTLPPSSIPQIGGNSFSAPSTNIVSSSDILANSDSEGYIIYNDRIYVGTGFYNFEESHKKQITNERLGFATETPENENEFASNVQGHFCSMMDYKPSFRICMPDLNGMYAIFDNLNDSSLQYGQDLFGPNGLNLTTDYTTVSFQTHDDWNTGNNNYHAVDLLEKDINDFIDSIYNSEMESVSDYSVFNKEQIHLIFHYANGINIKLRLIEGGFVFYEPFPEKYILVTTSVFDDLLRLL